MTIKALAREVVSLVPFDHLIQDARFFAICFSQLLYSHTRRECNKVTYNLTRFFKNITDFIVCIENVLSHFHFVLLANIAGLH